MPSLAGRGWRGIFGSVVTVSGALGATPVITTGSVVVMASAPAACDQAGNDAARAQARLVARRMSLFLCM